MINMSKDPNKFQTHGIIQNNNDQIVHSAISLLFQTPTNSPHFNSQQFYSTTNSIKMSERSNQSEQVTPPPSSAYSTTPKSRSSPQNANFQAMTPLSLSANYQTIVVVPKDKTPTALHIQSQCEFAFISSTITIFDCHVKRAKFFQFVN
ncbi:MAG: hypothetical protein EZS28_009555 [Streblomastix strix]|uniref:Uncharacterized protein n=1 Tax=Streblomastix strix TaxID=222440 RepID=A0A5J4WJJ2_9EUKA|nr:MAG: hypothetical protein EZS28_009555 [Streblomastix strix]